MDAIQKELQSRKPEIRKEMEALFKANMKITNWDVPEADNNEAATIIADILQEVLDEIRQDILAGTYEYY